MGDNVAYYGDNDIVAAVDCHEVQSGRTFAIARRLTGRDCDRKFLAALNRRLLKLEKAGRVYRDERYSYDNSRFWRAVK